jgi:predicted metal-binding protein
LCDRIQALHQNWSRQSELEVRGVDCLWTCDHPCSIALIGNNKPTYVLAKILVEDGNRGEIAEAVLQLSKRYLDSRNGNLPWKQFRLFRSDYVGLRSKRPKTLLYQCL